MRALRSLPSSRRHSASALLIALCAAILLLTCKKTGALPRQTPVILITVDTLRADHLSLYGNHSVHTPALDDFAHSATVFDNAFSNCPLTLPSHATLLSGLLPPHHGVRDNGAFTLNATHATLATMLKERGYATGASVSAYVLRRETGLARGFDAYDDVIPVIDDAAIGTLQRDGSISEANAETWIGAHAGQPFFYWLHLYEPHAPYSPPEPFRSRAANPYDGEIEYADAIVGKLLRFLRQRGLYDDAIIVIASDHGEGLMEHGEQEHGIFLYREALRVPLLMHVPGQRAARVATPVQLADVTPTIMSLLGSRLANVDGVAVLPNAPQRDLYSETYYARLHLGWSEQRSMTSSTTQFINTPRPELFDVVRDPRERHNIIDERRRDAVRMLRETTQYGDVAAAPQMSREEAARLASLGYVSATSTASGPLPDAKDRISDLAELKNLATPETRGNDRELATKLESLIARNPGWSDLRDQLGVTYERLGNLALAEKTYRDAIRVTPQLATQFALSLATVLMREGRYAEATQHATLAVQTEPAEAHQTLGMIALAKGDLTAARNEALLAREHPSEAMEADFLLAQIALAAHDESEALKRLDAVQKESAATRTPPPKHYYFVAADLLARRGASSDAEQMFARAIAAEPGERQAYANLALLQYMRHDVAAARATLAQMISANDDRATVEFAAGSLEHWGDREGARMFRSSGR